MNILTSPKRQRHRKLALVSTTMLTAYALIVRPWSVRWGATDDEVERAERAWATKTSSAVG